MASLTTLSSLTAFYVREEDRDAITEARRSVLNDDFGPATIAIQIAKIWEQGLLVELVATAVIPEDRFQA